MNNPVLVVKAFGTRMRRRFNLSFWCMAYNIFLMIMMVLSLVFSAIVFVMGQVVRLMRDRLIVAFTDRFSNGKTVTSAGESNVIWFDEDRELDSAA